MALKLYRTRRQVTVGGVAFISPIHEARTGNSRRSLR
ncbi:hypothetical protein SGPA1_12717 [Streptomyces misionensis JCM 4497]